MQKARDYIIVTVVIILVLAGIAGFGFYRDEVTAYVRLQAWNMSPVTDGTRQFLAAAAKGDSASLQPLLGPETPDLQPVRKNDKIVAFMVADYGGAKLRTLKSIAPTPEAKIGKLEIIYLDGGAATIDVEYPTHRLKLRWDRLAAGWRIVKMEFMQTR
jgi:hypothetical protein